MAEPEQRVGGVEGDVGAGGLDRRHRAGHIERRFRSSIDVFRALFQAAADDGDLPAHRDPEHEAIWLIALWDGLQIQWLYDRDGVDVAAHLRAHLDDVLPAR